MIATVEVIFVYAKLICIRNPIKRKNGGMEAGITVVLILDSWVYA